MTVDGEAHYDQAGWLVSLLIHGAVVIAIATAAPPTVATRAPYMRVDVRRPVPLVAPPPPPPEPVKPKTQLKPKPIGKVVDLTVPKAARPTGADTPAPPPVFGLNRKAVSLGGSFKVRVGNSLQTQPSKTIMDPEQVPENAPVALATISRMPRVREAVLPEYPEALRREGIEGMVLVEVVISALGRAVTARIVESVDPRFDSAALKAARDTLFEPARSAEGPVAVRIRLPVEFRLSAP